jgi:protein-disulfide isomerase
VGSQPILEDELSPLIEGELQRLRIQEYQAKRNALDDLINQKLIAAKAKEKGLTSEEFLRREIDDQLAEPTEAELQAYYFDRRNLSNVPYEQVKNQLLPGLKRQKTERARQDYIRRLRQSADVKVMLQAPKVQVAYDPARVRGNRDAPVTIVEFSDFQCPYCRKANATLQELLEKYKDRVRLAFRDFPLTEIHPQAQRAAEAARCAGQQGQFWAYHDLLFASPAMLSEEGLKQHARSLGLDATQFDTCLRDGKFKARVEEDLKEGTRAGVSGTPGFFINGTFLSGSQPLAAFERIIESELVMLKVHDPPPFISELRPSSGPVGTLVTVSGRGFTPTAGGVMGTPGGGRDYSGNTVQFGPKVVLKNLNSADGVTVQFDIPRSVAPGIYQVSIANENGASNTVSLTVIGN